MTAAWRLSQPRPAKACVHGECIRALLNRTAMKKSAAGTHLITSQVLEGTRVLSEGRARQGSRSEWRVAVRGGNHRLTPVGSSLAKANLGIRPNWPAGWFRGLQALQQLQNSESSRFCTSFGAKCKSQRLNGLSEIQGKDGFLC